MPHPLIMMRSCYNILSAHQQEIADYILNHPLDAAEMGIEELSEACNVSMTTVIRFLKKLGYDSYRTYKTDFIRNLAIEQSNAKPISSLGDYLDVNPDDNNRMIIQKVTSTLNVLLTDLPLTLDSAAIKCATEALCKAHSIFFFASGGTASLALDAYHKFLRLGKPVNFEQDNHLALVRICHFDSNDVLFLISRTGESREVIECAEAAKKQNAKIIVLTSMFDSTLASLADIILHNSVYDPKYDTDYMVSRFMHLVILDILFLCVRRDLGPQSEKSILVSRNALTVTKRSHGSRRNTKIKETDTDGASET